MGEKPSYYAVIPANIRYDKSLRANEKLLYGEISCLATKTGECWASNNYFAELYGVTPQAISKWINNLEKAGHITVRLIYNGKTIEKRVIKLCGVSTNIDRVSTNDLEGYQQKFKENNTSNNNIYCPSDDERDSQLSFSGENKAKQKEGTHELTDEEKFEVIWQRYPRKEGKNEAYRHYCSWLKGKTYCGKKVKLTQRQMWFAVCKYNDYVRENKIEKRFIQMGSTFFNSTIYEYLATEEEIEAHTR